MQTTVGHLPQSEMRILQCVACAKSNTQIAHVFGVDETSVKNDSGAILRKVGANSRAHAVALALRLSLL
jgi:two-component system response regulator DegU